MSKRLRVPATRSVLLQLRKHRKVLSNAAELLERKRRVLAKEALILLPQWRELRQEAYSRLGDAYASYSITRMRSTAKELHQIVGGIEPIVSFELQREVLAGVPIYQVTTKVAPLRPYFGLLGSTAELDRSVRSLGNAAERLVQLAAIESSLRSLAAALRKTSRQVRVLRDRAIPVHDATIREIEDILDEQERTYLFQLKRIR